MTVYWLTGNMAAGAAALCVTHGCIKRRRKVNYTNTRSLEVTKNISSNQSTAILHGVVCALKTFCPAERWSLYDRAEQGLLTLQTTDDRHCCSCWERRSVHREVSGCDLCAHKLQKKTRTKTQRFLHLFRFIWLMLYPL